ncbi:hypothetical protein FACS1894130_08000 [Spirochaetia bacterium]|nr:hypothetical protein FACS1894130_08000 [Spirochaetia bacterium]
MKLTFVGEKTFETFYEWMLIEHTIAENGGLLHDKYEYYKAMVYYSV